MPADERATLTYEQAHAIAARLINANVAHIDLPEAVRRTFMAQVAAALKESDRLAREDYMGKAEIAAKAFRSAQMPAAAAAADAVAAAIRASITTDEG